MVRKVLPETKSRPKTRKRASKKPVPTKPSPGSKPSAKPLAAAIRPPPPGQGKRGEAGYLGYLLRQAQAASRLSLERALAGLGVTPPQFVVLTMLNAYPGLSGADLARVALLTPQTIGVIIKNLERDGAIKRSPHPVHGRMLQWTLTSRGLTALAKCRRYAMAQERRLAAGLNGKAEATVRRWLSKIAENLQD
jgi:DNA-binding MarR family transcriptional regulator